MHKITFINWFAYTKTIDLYVINGSFYISLIYFNHYSFDIHWNWSVCFMHIHSTFMKHKILITKQIRTTNRSTNKTRTHIIPKHPKHKTFWYFPSSPLKRDIHRNNNPPKAIHSAENRRCTWQLMAQSLRPNNGPMSAAFSTHKRPINPRKTTPLQRGL